MSPHVLSLIVLLSFCNCSILFAQDCDRYTSIITNNSGERMYAFSNPINVLNKQANPVLDIDGFIIDSTLVILMKIKSGGPCINQEDDIVVKFNDGTTMKLKSAYPANCDY
jgi:hypothetical protein